MSKQLHSWSVVCSGDGLTPPELQTYHLCGFCDNMLIRTSKIVKTEDRMVHTFSGSVYELMDVDPNYEAWVEKNLGQPIDPNYPVRLTILR